MQYKEQTNAQITDANIQKLDSNPYPSLNGLSSLDAANLLKSGGYNELPSSSKSSFIRKIFEIIRQPMFALLIGGGLVYLMLGDAIEALFLLIFACLSIGITIVQETRSERVLEALRNLASPRATVIRDGKRVTIAGREVVVGDLMVINEGDRVAADASIISAHDLLLDESLLTGESVPVSKVERQNSTNQSAVDSVNTTISGEKSSSIFAGSLVVRGTGLALVQTIGVKSEMGKIGHALNTIDIEQPLLQKQLHGLVRNFTIVGAVAGLTAVILYGILHNSWLEALLSGIALGMSLLPEEFPLVLAVFMAMGAWRISKVQVLTRRASAIETLGATTVLCTDKTGTLTENKMSVVAIQSESSSWEQSGTLHTTADIKEVLNAALLACSESPTDPMDIAIHLLAKSMPDLKNRSNFKLIRAYGLRPNCFAVANVFTDNNGENIAYAKGAMETITSLCGLTDKQLSIIKNQSEKLALKGVRVLGVAKVKINNAELKELPESLNSYKFEYLGLIGLSDPLRENVPDAVAECRAAGIKVMMITGDYPITALAIGQQAGLDYAHVITGETIEGMTDNQLVAALKITSIFARIQPNQKLRIVQLLKNAGEIVAMTGDGVNDAPAIKAADIGIAMGMRGSDVAREASSIVLLNDDFASIVKTIKLGRRIYDNLRKAIEYIIAVHIPIAGLAILPLLFGLPLIITPIHIAFLEMIIDPACSVVFEAEPEEGNIMQRPPRDPKSPLVLPKRMIWAIIQGLIVLGVLTVILVATTAMVFSEENRRTLMFTTLVLMNMGLILLNRSFSSSFLAAILKPSLSLWILFFSISTLLAIIVIWQPAQLLFRFGSLNMYLILVSLIASISAMFILGHIKSHWFKYIGH